MDPLKGTQNKYVENDGTLNTESNTARVVAEVTKIPPMNLYITLLVTTEKLTR